MRATTRTALGAVAGLTALWIAWGLYSGRSTERVPYETLERFDGVELRRYPETVLVETTAPDAGRAFWRLYQYIDGANEGGASVAMTAPVRTGGEDVPMTAPVRTTRDEAVTMAFYLPPEYTSETAPVPTDPAVRLVVEPPRTVAVRRFSWYATPRRTRRARRRLLDALTDRGVTVREDPVLLQYDDPGTPPFMRTNEVAVGVAESETE